MSRIEIIEKATEYIRNLPDKTDITMYQVVKAAYPEAEAEITNPAFFDLLYAIKEAVENSGIILDFSAHEGKVEGLPFNLDFIVRKNDYKK